MKIYDCFIFFNENLLTEIRFNILDKFVDYFVVCESYYDHRGNKKGYLFDLNKFKKFNDKIIYVQIDEFQENLGVWEIQDYQRNFLKNGLKNTKPDDLNAKGSGGLRQMHNYVDLNTNMSIETPSDDYKPNTIGNSNEDNLENIIKSREADISIHK